MISLEVHADDTHSEAVDAASEGENGPASSESGCVHQAPAPENNISSCVQNSKRTSNLF